MGFHSTNIQMAIDVAKRQGCDVLAASAHPAMPRFGRLAHVWVLTDNGHVVAESHRYRVTDLSINEDGEATPEFGQGFYHSSLAKAQQTFDERTRRSWLDWQVHEDPSTRDQSQ